MKKIADALVDMSDFMLCVSNDLHYIHLKMMNAEFDVLHREVFKTYYEQAANDYDELAEWAIAFKGEVGNPNLARERIKYPEYLPLKGSIEKDSAVHKADELIDQVCTGFGIILQGCQERSPVQSGLANYLQTRLEYWSKELLYFNHRRIQTWKGAKK